MASVAPNIMADSVARAGPPRALLTSKDIGTLRLRMIKQVLLAVGGLYSALGHVSRSYPTVHWPGSVGV